MEYMQDTSRHTVDETLEQNSDMVINEAEEETNEAHDLYPR